MTPDKDGNNFVAEQLLEIKQKEHYKINSLDIYLMLGLIDRQEAELSALRRENEIYRAALKKIAKPALGGKQQQWCAQEALALGPEGKSGEGL